MNTRRQAFVRGETYRVSFVRSHVVRKSLQPFMQAVQPMKSRTGFWVLWVAFLWAGFGIHSAGATALQAAPSQQEFSSDTIRTDDSDATGLFPHPFQLPLMADGETSGEVPADTVAGSAGGALPASRLVSAPPQGSAHWISASFRSERDCPLLCVFRC